MLNRYTSKRQCVHIFAMIATRDTHFIRLFLVIMHTSVQLEPLTRDTPQTKRGHERCLALLESATNLFLEHGYEAVSLDDIVNHAGGSKASIYKYFGNKKGLFKAICDYRRDQFYRDITLTCICETEELRTYLIRILTNFLKHIIQPKNIAFIRLILNQTQKDPALAQYIHENGAQMIQKTIAQALSQAHEKGQLNCPQPNNSAMLYFGILRDYEWRIILGVDLVLDREELNNHIEYCVDRFLAGHQKL